jgi:hypothetical protein
MLLVFRCAVAQFPKSVEEHRSGQLVPGFAFV